MNYHNTTWNLGSFGLFLASAFKKSVLSAFKLSIRRSGSTVLHDINVTLSDHVWREVSRHNRGIADWREQHIQGYYSPWSCPSKHCLKTAEPAWRKKSTAIWTAGTTYTNSPPENWSTEKLSPCLQGKFTMPSSGTLKHAVIFCVGF